MENLINKTIDFVRKNLEKNEKSHDWWHIQRVWNLSKKINKTEPGNQLIIELGSLLHDIADPKFNQNNELLGAKITKDFLSQHIQDDNIIKHVTQIVQHISFKGGNIPVAFYSDEFAIVQDADRLDALGAIGIARTFHYGGYKNSEIYNPAIKPNLNQSPTEYREHQNPTLNHFYEKLLLLKDRMNTRTGKKLAEQRHVFMLKYLEQFYSEWEEK